MQNICVTYKGFTLVELIIVIVLAAILAVTAYPLVGGRSNVEVAVYQGELMSLLRLQQQKALQDTVSGEQYGVDLSPNMAAAVPAFPDGFVDTGSSVSLQPVGEIYFDAMGCPYVGPIKPAELCAYGAVTLQITGGTTREILINSQGFIQTPD